MRADKQYMKHKTISAAKRGHHLASWIPGAVILAIVLIIMAFVSTWLRMHRATAYCANSVSCIRDLTGQFEPGKGGVFMGHQVNLPASLAALREPRRVLGDTTASKHIFVDLSTQRLTAYEGNAVVMSFPISSGRWHVTPTGDFRIWIKLRYTHMEGGSKADDTYYNLYNVPYTMFFYNDEVPKSAGFSLHGAYWHNNFGHPMSHGCVNIRPEDAGKLFEWADPVSSGGNTTYPTPENPGTLVTITGTTPDE